MTTTNAITQTPLKPTPTQSLVFFDPSFFAHCKAFENFFSPSITFVPLPILLQAKKDDPTLSTVYTWLTQRQNFFTPTTILKANYFLFTYYKQLQHL